MTNNDGGEIEKTCDYIKLSSSEMEKTKCILCQSNCYDSLKYGEAYQIDDLVVHYFCLLFSSSLVQQGEDDQGILGFFPKDIRSEAKRGSRLRCCYCRLKGATLGCNVKSCKKAFHLPCGLKKGSLHQFFDQFRSFCPSHRPSQSVDPNILKVAAEEEDGLFCPICYESVPNKVSDDTLWAPCCKKRWFHRICVERQAQAQGYFFKCPMCNNKDIFNKEMKQYGVYIPEMDAAWEREPDAFRELLHRYSKCDSANCRCPDGRTYSQNTGSWRMLRCNSCGSQGTHVVCSGLKISALNNSFRCPLCVEVLSKDKRTGSINTNQTEPSRVEQAPVASTRTESINTNQTEPSRVEQAPVASTSSSSLRRSGDIIEPQAPKRRKPSPPSVDLEVPVEPNCADVLERRLPENLSPQKNSNQFVLPGPSSSSSNDDEEGIIVVDDSESDIEVLDDKPAPQAPTARTYPVPLYVDKELFTKDGKKIKVVKVTASDTKPVEDGSLGAVKTQQPEVKQETVQPVHVDKPSTSLLPNCQDVSISLVPATPKSYTQQNTLRKEESSPSNLGIKINNVRHCEEFFSPCRTEQTGSSSIVPLSPFPPTVQPQFSFPQNTLSEVYLVPVPLNGRTAYQPALGPPGLNMMKFTQGLNMLNLPPHLKQLSAAQLQQLGTLQTLQQLQQHHQQQLGTLQTLQQLQQHQQQQQQQSGVQHQRQPSKDVDVVTLD